MDALEKLLATCQPVDEAAFDKLAVEGNLSAQLTHPKFPIFGGLFESTLRCNLFSGCGAQSRKIEPMVGLSVNLPRGAEVTVKVAIGQAQEWEHLRQSVARLATMQQAIVFGNVATRPSHPR